jgi:Uma2 family endonuclease
MKSKNIEDSSSSIPISKKIDQSLNYKYASSIPEYLRIDPKSLEKSQNNQNDRIYILSKQENDGWLTVDSTTLNRKNAYEKQKKLLVNRETSPLSPNWM